MKDSGPLSEIVERLANYENEHLQLTLELEISQSKYDLMQHPGWKSIEGSLRPVLNSSLRQLATRRMDEYELGRRQGLIWGITALLQTEPLSQEDASEKRKRLSEIREGIEECQRLLR